MVVKGESDTFLYDFMPMTTIWDTREGRKEGGSVIVKHGDWPKTQSAMNANNDRGRATTKAGAGRAAPQFASESTR